jgi:hypothetical protein
LTADHSARQAGAGIVRRERKIAHLAEWKSPVESNESITQLFRLSQLLLLAVSITVGLRMLWLTRRTRCLPELLLGLNCLLAAGLGYMLLVSGVIQIVQPDADVTLAERLVVAGWFCIAIGFSANVFFNYHVYRPAIAWAQTLGGVVVCVFWFGYVGRAFRGDFAEVRQFDGPGTSSIASRS